MDSIITALVTESRWIAPSIGLAVLSGIVTLRRSRASDRQRIAAALTMYAGSMVGVLAFGHLLAVSLELGLGSLEGRAPVLYGIGLLLIVPAFLTVAHARRLAQGDEALGTRTTLWNAVLAGSLLVTGPLNLPLAIPALLNVGYVRHRRPIVGHAIVGVSILLCLLLFAGSVRFFLSGGSFEEFNGM